MASRYLSNAYVVGDEPGGVAVFVDSGAPLAPLLTFIEENRLTPTHVLRTHGHADHVSDAAQIAKRTGATVVSNFEICNWLEKQGVKKTEPMNIGGGIALPFGRVQMTIAHHSSLLTEGTGGGNPGGFGLTLADGQNYFA